MDILFNGAEHKDFFESNLKRCRYSDVYHTALIYCLGIDADTRSHLDSIYNLQSGRVKPECLQAGWITSGSARIIRMAFNLYCNGQPSVYNYEDAEKKLSECAKYTVQELFCCGYAPYFWQAIQLRYPEYCE